MALAQSSQDMWRSRGRQPQTLGNDQPRHRSESRRLSNRRRPVNTLARKCDHRPGALHEGDLVRIFSRSADTWVDGEVIQLKHGTCVRVEYEVEGYRYGKAVHLQSEHLLIPSSPSKSSFQDQDRDAFTVAYDSTHMPSVPSSAERLTRSRPFQGCRSALPAVCGGDPSKYYIHMDVIWQLIEQETVVLIHGRWLLERSRAIPFKPLPCRQHLPPEAIVGFRELVDKFEYVACINDDTGENGPFAKDETFCHAVIVSISHCWLSLDHPDPEGLLLAELAPKIEQYGLDFNFSESLECDGFCGAFFFAWCSLYQPYHERSSSGQYLRQKDDQLTVEEKADHDIALANMDIWYAHKNTEVWMLTNFYPVQGAPYELRGWPTWERTVSELLADGNRLLDLGNANVCRSPPLTPDDFEAVIDGKHFTCGDIDKQRVKENFRRNFCHVTSCVKRFNFTGLCRSDEDAWNWNRDTAEHFQPENLAFLECQTWAFLQCFSLSKVLCYCSSLKVLVITWRSIDNAGACGLATGIRQCSNIEFVDLSVNRIGDGGAWGLGDGLQQCTRLQFLGLWRNMISDVGGHTISRTLRNVHVELTEPSPVL